MNKILVSISGGRTSAMMAFLIKMMYGATHEIIYVFANTGKEREETLQFLDKLDKHFGLGVVWVEAFVHHGTRKSSTHKVVNFETASRDGEPFEEVIKKYGIPNNKFIHCTRELKKNPIQSYAKSLGWKDYKLAIGIRADEPKRLNWEAEKKELVWYMLAHHNIKKQDVNAFWKNQPFDLELKSHEGNCDLCYKKSKRKLLTIIQDNPNVTNWWGKMESKYSYVIPQGLRKKDTKPPFRFYRDNETTDDLLEESQMPFEPFDDKELPVQHAMNFNIEMDAQEHCAESCEPFA